MSSLFEKGILKHKEEEAQTHVIPSLEIVSMMCKLIESANHLCIIFTITKYMDDLLAKTFIDAQGTTLQR